MTLRAVTYFPSDFRDDSRESGRDYVCYAQGSKPSDIYEVRRHPDGHWTCECPDYFYRRHECKHITWGRCRLAEDIEAVGELL